MNCVRPENKIFCPGSWRPRAAPDSSTPMSLDLTGPTNGVAAAKVSIANTKHEVAQIQYCVTDVRRADGIGPAFPPRVSITPGQLDLRPGEEGSLTLALGVE